ncbi:hypothetical protein KP509_06G090300 [Ceratopteris richardii]|uniref:FAD-binding FR-type domain-containing protein n=1 Tax=Ceratopteris richardii TaxID=49495 RepID=A0A8T2UQK3_CERRI|nr:hypothetical protein KP509_06G090300 [Ceratopteris richardii]
MRKKQRRRPLQEQRPSGLPSLITYPLWVRSPLGVLTTADILLIMGFFIVVMYYFGRKCYKSFKIIDTYPYLYDPNSGAQQKLYEAFRYFGTISMIPFALLWVPVARGSPLLRLLGMPFQRAVRYHIWLSCIMIIFASVHGTGFIVFFLKTGQRTKIYSKHAGYTLAGLLAWIVGIAIWITSLPFFRRRWQEFFFSVHHAYTVFTLLLLYHQINSYRYYIIPLLLFLVDRFLRFLQSRKLVDVLSAKILESDAIELRFPLSSVGEALPGKALSTWCIQLPSVSKAQWHFFNTAFTQNTDPKEVAIIIKPLGGWTNKLLKQLLSDTSRPFSFKARVEGPYDDPSDFYLEYQTLILVGGGIGIYPLLAIVEDILIRYARGENENTRLPTSIELYYCVHTWQDICVLDLVELNNVLESFGLQIKVHAYITSRSRDDYQATPQLQSNMATNRPLDLDVYRIARSTWNSRTLRTNQNTVSPVSDLSAAGSNIWVGIITIASMIGYFVISGLANLHIIRYYELSNYNHAHVLLASVLLGILVSGGLFAFFWHSDLSSKNENLRITTQPPQIVSDSASSSVRRPEVNFEGLEAFTWKGDLRICSRPEWNDVFNELGRKYKGNMIGVIVCGPTSMQQDVAIQCKKHSAYPSSFQYYSLPFDF